MKTNVKIEFPIESDFEIDEDALKELIFTYLSEAIENDELEYTADIEEDEETH